MAEIVATTLLPVDRLTASSKIWLALTTSLVWWVGGLYSHIGTSGGIAVGRRQAVDWQRHQWPLFPPLFSFSFSFFLFFSVVNFSHRRSARIKKLIQRKRSDLGFLIWGVLRQTKVARIKKFVFRKLIGMPILLQRSDLRFQIWEV